VPNNLKMDSSLAARNFEECSARWRPSLGVVQMGDLDQYQRVGYEVGSILCPWAPEFLIFLPAHRQPVFSRFRPIKIARCLERQVG
jgi:hypothetical protein